MEANEKKDVPLEELLIRLDDVLKNMEARDISLEDSFACYEEGMKLVRQCTETLDRVEKQVRILEEETAHEF